MDKKVGYVTFADILGWKGIWRIKEDPVEELLSIRFKVKEYIEDILFKYEINIIENNFPQYYSEDIKSKLRSAGRIEIENEIAKYIKGKNEDKTLGDKKTEEKRKEENKKSTEEFNKFKEDFSKFKVYLNLELISDTFVITSYSNNFEKETFIHARISQELINRCLEHQLLIRGATSYGEYYKDNLVFVGPAIDDAASWHELGEEIGIYFTPKAQLSMSNNDLIKDNFKKREFYYPTNGQQRNIKLGSILVWDKPKLKIESFNTYLIDWKDSEKFFVDTINQYETILPDVYKKVIFSIQRLNILKENKITREEDET